MQKHRAVEKLCPCFIRNEYKMDKFSVDTLTVFLRNWVDTYLLLASLRSVDIRHSKNSFLM